MCKVRGNQERNAEEEVPKMLENTNCSCGRTCERKYTARIGEKQAEEGKCESRTADNEKHYPRFNSFLTHNAETDREKDDAEKSEPDKADEGTEAGQLDFRFGAEKKTSELEYYLFGRGQLFKADKINRLVCNNLKNYGNRTDDHHDFSD